jgi:glycosyltransferase involved in cell wall biosynthesis
VVAVAEGGPASLIDHGETGLLASADAEELAAKLLQVLGQPRLRQRLRQGGLTAARGRSWETALWQLAEGYHAALRDGPGVRHLVA